MAGQFQLAPRDFLRHWVVAEVVAKLTETPILVWIKRHGLAGAGSEVVSQFNLHTLGMDATVHLLACESPGTDNAMAFGYLLPAPRSGRPTP